MSGRANILMSVLLETLLHCGWVIDRLLVLIVTLFHLLTFNFFSKCGISDEDEATTCSPTDPEGSAAALSRLTGIRLFFCSSGKQRIRADAHPAGTCRTVESLTQREAIRDAGGRSVTMNVSMNRS